MKVVYIAGPFRAKTPFGVKLNVDAAEKEMHDVVTLVHMHGLKISVMCPHAMTRNLDGTADDPYWLEATLEMMRRCDAVLMLPTWKESDGAIGECEEALRLGMPVFYARHELLDWCQAEAPKTAGERPSRRALLDSDGKDIAPGVYNIEWLSGAASEAVVHLDKAGTLIVSPINWFGPAPLVEQVHLIRSIKRIAAGAEGSEPDKGTVYHCGKPVAPGRYRVVWSDGLTSGATVYTRLDGVLMLSVPDLGECPRRLSTLVNSIRSFVRLDQAKGA